ncbi:hypothetical protein EVAR_95542_1 [Eumeta japonica]|uniref:Uncharacterized protein n=1 Tax=Eumeta variegata TaxID=151549 RepID=A0A4C1UJ66_EUMVA|nr:hypothetical protein EVAR_95542_1 [Eumeta japonica]
MPVTNALFDWFNSFRLKDNKLKICRRDRVAPQRCLVSKKKTDPNTKNDRIDEKKRCNGKNGNAPASRRGTDCALKENFRPSRGKPDYTPRTISPPHPERAIRLRYIGALDDRSLSY